MLSPGAHPKPDPAPSPHRHPLWTGDSYSCLTASPNILLLFHHTDWKNITPKDAIPPSDRGWLCICGLSPQSTALLQCIEPSRVPRKMSWGIFNLLKGWHGQNHPLEVSAHPCTPIFWSHPVLTASGPPFPSSLFQRKGLGITPRQQLF